MVPPYLRRDVLTRATLLIITLPPRRTATHLVLLAQPPRHKYYQQSYVGVTDGFVNNLTRMIRVALLSVRVMICCLGEKPDHLFGVLDPYGLYCWFKQLFT